MPILALSLALWSVWAPATTEPPLEPTPIIDLQWSAPAECPVAADIEAAIAELVGRPLGQDPERRMLVAAAIHLEANEYRLQLRIEQPDGTTLERRLAASECVELGEPVAVMVAIAVSASIEPVHSQVPFAPEHSDGHTAIRDHAGPTTKRRPPQTVPSSERNAPRQRRPQGALVIAGGLASANLPGLGAAVQASGGLVLKRLRLNVVVTHEFNRTTRRQIADEPAGARFNLTAVRPEVCWRPGRQRWHLPLCLGPELGVAVASGFGVAQAQTIRHVWLALAAGPGFVWMAHRSVGLRVQTELVVSPGQRRFTLAGSHLFTTRAFGARVLAGVEFHLP